jgi:hypothetical protein
MGKLGKKTASVHQRSHMDCPGIEPGLCGEKLMTNLLNYGTVYDWINQLLIQLTSLYYHNS